MKPLSAGRTVCLQPSQTGWLTGQLMVWNPRSPKTRRYTEYEVGRDLENSGYLLRIDLLVN
jgi:hypothetical protein